MGFPPGRYFLRCQRKETTAVKSGSSHADRRAQPTPWKSMPDAGKNERGFQSGRSAYGREYFSL